MNFLQLFKQTKSPNPKVGKVIFFVDSDGVFKKVDSDGTISEVGGSGPLTNIAIELPEGSIAAPIDWAAIQNENNQFLIEGLSDGTFIIYTRDSSRGFSVTTENGGAQLQISDVNSSINSPLGGKIILLDDVDDNPTLKMHGFYNEPDDAILISKEFCFWFDKTNGASKLMIKGKSQDGTVVSGEIALS